MGVHALAVVGHVGPNVGGGAMDAPHALAALAALGQPTRLSIFRLLVKKEPEGLSAGALAEAVGCPHNTLSTHVAILARAGLVNGKTRGTNHHLSRRCSRHPRAHCVPRHGLLQRPPGTVRPGRPGGMNRPIAVALPRSTAEKETKRNAMTWTLTNVFIETVEGIAGAHRHGRCRQGASFGVLGHSVAGAMGGADQRLFPSDNRGDGGQLHRQRATGRRRGHPGGPARILGGLAAGAIVTMAVGFAKHSLDRTGSEKS